MSSINGTNNSVNNYLNDLLPQLQDAEKAVASAASNANGPRGTDGPTPGVEASPANNATPQLQAPAKFDLDSQIKSLAGVVSSSVEILVIISKIASEDRRVNRDLVMGKYEQQAQESMQAAEKLKDAAKAGLISGLVSAGVQALAATVSLGMSIKAANQQINVADQNKQIGKVSDALKFGDATAEGGKYGNLGIPSVTDDASASKFITDGTAAAQKLAAEATKMTAAAQAISQYGGSLGQVSSTIGEYNVKVEEAEAKKIDARASMRNAEIEAFRSCIDSLKELSQKAQEISSSIMRSEMESQRIILS